MKSSKTYDQGYQDGFHDGVEITKTRQKSK